MALLFKPFILNPANHFNTRKKASATSRLVCTRTARPVSASQRPVASAFQAEEGIPWKFGFQCNERYLSWDQSAQLKLLKLVLAEKLGVTTEEVEARADQLALLLPDLLTRMEYTRVDILQPLLEDLPGLTQQLIGLRECLPGVNLSRLVAKHPRLLSEYRDPARLEERLQQLRAALPGVNVPVLVDEEPHLLHVDIGVVLQNCKRLMPNTDPVQLLVSQPQMVLTAVEAGLSSAMDVEGGAPVTAH